MWPFAAGPAELTIFQALALVEALSEPPKPAQESSPAPRLSRAELVNLARQQDPGVKLAWDDPTGTEAED